MSLKEAIKLKVKEEINENISLASLKCNEAYDILESAFDNQDIEQIQKAAGLYLEATDLYSRLIDPYLALGYIFWQMNMINEAKTVINKALELEPFNREAQRMYREINSELDLINLPLRNNDSDLKNIAKNVKKLPKQESKILSGFLASIGKIFSNRENNKKPKKTNEFALMMAETSKRMQTDK